MFHPLLLICFILVVAGSSDNSTSPKWSYSKEETNPYNWPHSHKTMCGGLWQSPIDIRSIQAEFRTQLEPIRIVRSALSPPGVFKLHNNGHSIGIQFPLDTWFVSFDGTDSRDYELVQVHFHWGQNDSLGSEHTLDGKRYAMEGHFVTYRKSMYHNVHAALGSPNGLAVLGILYELSNETNPSKTHLGLLGNATTILKQPIELDTFYPMPEVDLTRLFGQTDLGKYFRYQGSLTTPPCTENVMWTVFEKPVPVTAEELRLLRGQKFPTTEDESNMANNFRPTQPLNARNAPIFRKLYRASASRPNFLKLPHVLLLTLGYLYYFS